MGGEASQVREVVIDERQRGDGRDCFGLGTALTGRVAGRDDALDRKAVVAEVPQTGRLVLGFERGDTDQVEAGIVQAVAGFDGARDRRHRGPELLVEVTPEVGPPLFVEPLDIPAVHRPVGERVALGGRGAERAGP